MQSDEHIRAYNREIQQEAAVLFGPKPDHSNGATAILPWWAITSGAASFDGTHYSLQVNLEKVHIILGLLDMIWSDIVRRGGMLADDILVT